MGVGLARRPCATRSGRFLASLCGCSHSYKATQTFSCAENSLISSLLSTGAISRIFTYRIVLQYLLAVCYDPLILSSNRTIRLDRVTYRAAYGHNNQRKLIDIHYGGDDVMPNDQTECPNCNGYMVSDEVIRLQDESAKPKRPLTTTNKVAVVVFLAIVPTAVALNYKANTLITLAAGVCGLLIALLAIWAYSRNYNSLVAEHHYFCNLCGFRWQWREDRPYPYTPGTRLAPNADELRRIGEAQLARNSQNAGYFIIQQRDHPNG